MPPMCSSARVDHVGSKAATKKELVHMCCAFRRSRHAGSPQTDDGGGKFDARCVLRPATLTRRAILSELHCQLKTCKGCANDPDRVALMGYMTRLFKFEIPERIAGQTKQSHSEIVFGNAGATTCGKHAASCSQSMWDWGRKMWIFRVPCLVTERGGATRRRLKLWRPHR